jgi:hypothetical protein
MEVHCATKDATDKAKQVLRDAQYHYTEADITDVQRIVLQLRGDLDDDTITELRAIPGVEVVEPD